MPSGIGAAGSGAELTREQVVGMPVEPLMAQSVVLRAGPRMFETSGGAPVRIHIPLIDYWSLGTGVGASATYWHGENELIEESDPDFGEVTLLPSITAQGAAVVDPNEGWRPLPGHQRGPQLATTGNLNWPPAGTSHGHGQASGSP